MTPRTLKRSLIAALVLTLLPGCSSTPSHAAAHASTTSGSTPTHDVDSDSHYTGQPSAREHRTDGSTLETFYVKGKASGLSGTVLVWLPPGYDSSKKYPVIEMLHGFPGHPESVFPSTHIDRVVKEEVTAHKIAPPIIVLPQENMPPSRDTECIDAPHEASGTWLGVDVPEFVRNSFPTNRNRNAWATWGFSAGGWCAAVVASQHPNTFSAAASLVGYFKPDFEPGYQPFAPSSAQYRAADLVALMKKSPPNVAYYVLAAEQDELSYPTSAQFAAAVRAPASVQTRLLSHGGHQGNVWIPYLAESIDFLGKASGFKATQP